MADSSAADSKEVKKSGKLAPIIETASFRLATPSRDSVEHQGSSKLLRLWDPSHLASLSASATVTRSQSARPQVLASSMSSAAIPSSIPTSQVPGISLTDSVSGKPSTSATSSSPVKSAFPARSIRLSRQKSCSFQPSSTAASSQQTPSSLSLSNPTASGVSGNPPLGKT